jgi:hypothetical protein
MKFLRLAFVDHDPTTWWFIAWALSVPLYLALQAWFGITWTGRWRKVALIPLIGVVVTTILVLVGRALISDGPPIDLPTDLTAIVLAGLVLFAPVGFIYEVTAGIIRMSVRRPTTTGSTV